MKRCLLVENLHKNNYFLVVYGLLEIAIWINILAALGHIHVIDDMIFLCQMWTSYRWMQPPSPAAWRSRSGQAPHLPRLTPTTTLAEEKTSIKKGTKTTRVEEEPPTLLPAMT